jgi:hypothetical protein
MRRNLKRREEYLKRQSEALKKSDPQIEAEMSTTVKTFMCGQCEQTFLNEKGLKIHVGKTHKENIPQLDGIIDDIIADEAVKTCDLTKQREDQKEADEADRKHEEKPFELRFLKSEKKYSSDIYDSYLEAPLPLIMPQTILHPIEGIGEFHGYFKKIKNKYTYRFKTNCGMSWKTFHIGEKSPWD